LLWEASGSISAMRAVNFPSRSASQSAGVLSEDSGKITGAETVAASRKIQTTLVP
jgi:hypothetical protein